MAGLELHPQKKGLGGYAPMGIGYLGRERKCGGWDFIGNVGNRGGEFDFVGRPVESGKKTLGSGTSLCAL